MNLSAPDDDGLSLVELIIYMLIGSLIVGVLTTIFINGLSAQTSTTDRNAATGQANAAAASLQQSIRNAVDVSPDSGSSNALVAVVATGSNDNSWQCRAWVLTGAKELKYKASSSAIDTSNTTTGWVTLAKGVTGALSGSMFSIASTTVSYGFSLTAGAQTVPVKGSATTQAVASGTVPSCW